MSYKWWGQDGSFNQKHARYFLIWANHWGIMSSRYYIWWLGCSSHRERLQEQGNLFYSAYLTHRSGTDFHKKWKANKNNICRYCNKKGHIESNRFKKKEKEKEEHHANLVAVDLVEKIIDTHTNHALTVHVNLDEDDKHYCFFFLCGCGSSTLALWIKRKK